MSESLSIADVAGRYGISQKTVRRMIARGDLRAYRLGARLIRVRSEDAERAMHPIPTAEVVA